MPAIIFERRAKVNKPFRNRLRKIELMKTFSLSADEALISDARQWRLAATHGELGAAGMARDREAELRLRFRTTGLNELWAAASTFGQPAQVPNSTEILTHTTLAGLSDATAAFFVATADSGTDALAKPLSDLLHNFRALLDMDIAFVAEFVEGRRVFRHVASTAESAPLVQVGQCHALEETYCQRVVDGRLPRAIQNSALLPEASQLEATHTLRIAAYLSAPVVLHTGEVYGTLCCISHRPRTTLGPLQADALRSVADLVAKEIQKHRNERQHL